MAPRALSEVQHAATTEGNVFESLMTAVRTCSLGQITEAFFEVGGQYRRNV
jgi:methylmalonyl-CoA mutase